MNLKDIVYHMPNEAMRNAVYGYCGHRDIDMIKSLSDTYYREGWFLQLVRDLRGFPRERDFRAAESDAWKAAAQGLAKRLTETEDALNRRINEAESILAQLSGELGSRYARMFILPKLEEYDRKYTLLTPDEDGSEAG